MWQARVSLPEQDETTGFDGDLPPDYQGRKE